MFVVVMSPTRISTVWVVRDTDRVSPRRSGEYKRTFKPFNRSYVAIMLLYALVLRFFDAES